MNNYQLIRPSYLFNQISFVCYNLYTPEVTEEPFMSYTYMVASVCVFSLCKVHVDHK